MVAAVVAVVAAVAVVWAATVAVVARVAAGRAATTRHLADKRSAPPGPVFACIGYLGGVLTCVV